MVKGCQRSAVVLRGGSSALFDEAYFILKTDKINVSEGQMLAEANRIVKESVYPHGKEEKLSAKAHLRSFLFGLICGALILALFWLFLG